MLVCACLDKSSYGVFLLSHDFILFVAMKTSLVLQHERVHSKLSDKTLKSHIMQMMKMGIAKSTHEGVSRESCMCV